MHVGSGEDEAQQTCRECALSCLWGLVLGLSHLTVSTSICSINVCVSCVCISLVAVRLSSALFAEKSVSFSRRGSILEWGGAWTWSWTAIY